MNAEIKDKWIEALRSGKYKQCGDALQKDGAYCCLGVLCDIVSPQDWQKPDDCHIPASHRGAKDFPNDTIYGEIDLDVDMAYRLAHLNDTGESFLEIAEYIQENL